MGFIIQELCRDDGKEHGNYYLGFRVWVLGFMVQDSGFKGLGFSVQGLMAGGSGSLVSFLGVRVKLSVFLFRG